MIIIAVPDYTITFPKWGYSKFCQTNLSGFGKVDIISCATGKEHAGSQANPQNAGVGVVLIDVSVAVP